MTISRDDDLVIPDSAQVDEGAYTSPQSLTTDINVSANMSILDQVAPYFGTDSDLMYELATSGMSSVEIAERGAGSLSLVQTQMWKDDLQNLSPSQQRGHWFNMTESQQDLLIQLGYIPPIDFPEPSLFQRGLGAVAGAFKFGWNLIPGQQQEAIKTGVSGAFAGLNWLGDRAPHLYRTRAQQDPWQRFLAEGAGFAAAGFVAVASRGQGGGRASQGVYRAVSSLMRGGGTLRSGAILIGSKELGSNATALMLDAPSGFSNYINAFKQTYDGDRHFTLEAKQEAFELTNSDQLLNLAQDIASGLHPKDIAAEIAALRDVVDNNTIDLGKRLEAADVVAEQYAEPGTPEYEQVKKAVYELLDTPEFRSAVVTLALSKRTVGRDIASSFGLTPGTGAWSNISGGLDALYLVVMDPLNLAGTAVRAERFARYRFVPKFKNLRVEESQDMLTGLSNLYYGSGTTKADRKVVRWIDEVIDAANNQRFDQAPTNLKDLYLSLIEYMRSTGKIVGDEVVNPLTAETFFNEYFSSMDNLRHLMGGVGTRRGVGQQVWQPITSTSLRGRIRNNAIAFRTAMTEPWNNHVVRKIIEESGENPNAIFGELADETPMGTQIVPTYLLRNSKIKLTEKGGLGWMLGRAMVPLHYYRGPRVGNVINRISRMSSRGSIDLSTGEGVEEFVSTMAAIFELPRWIELSYLNTLMNQGNQADRLAVLRSFYDVVFDVTGLKGTGLRGTEAGRALYEEFVLRIGSIADDMLARQQQYAVGGIDNIIATGADGNKVPAAVLPGQIALRIAVPDPRTLIKAKKKSLWFGDVNKVATPVDIVETASGMWRVSVVARPGFIPRAVGEEWLAAMFRGELGEWGAGITARGMARYSEFLEALRTPDYKRTDRQRFLLRQDKNGRYKYAYSGHLYPLVWMLDSLQGGKLVDTYVNRYQSWFRRATQNGLGRGNLGKLAYKWFGVNDASEIGNNPLLSSLVLGRTNSWRRTAALGVSQQLRQRGNELYGNLHVAAAARGVSSSQQGRLSEVQEFTNTTVHDVGVDGLPIPKFVDDSNFSTRRPGEDGFEAAYHWRLHHTMNDPVYGDILEDVLARVVPYHKDGFDVDTFGNLITDFRRLNIRDQRDALILFHGRDHQTNGLISALRAESAELQQTIENLKAAGNAPQISIDRLEQQLQILEWRRQYYELFLTDYDAWFNNRELFDNLALALGEARVSAFAAFLDTWAYENFGLLADDKHVLSRFYTGALAMEHQAATRGVEFYDLELMRSQLQRRTGDELFVPERRRTVYRGLDNASAADPSRMYIDDQGNLHLTVSPGDWQTPALSTSVLPEQAAFYANRNMESPDPAIATSGVVIEMDLDHLLTSAGTTLEETIATTVGFSDARRTPAADIPAAALMQPSMSTNETAEIQILRGFTKRVLDDGQEIDEIVIPAGKWRTLSTGEFGSLRQMGTERSDYLFRTEARMRKTRLPGTPHFLDIEVQPSAIAEFDALIERLYDELIEATDDFIIAHHNGALRWLWEDRTFNVPDDVRAPITGFVADDLRAVWEDLIDQNDEAAIILKNEWARIIKPLIDTLKKDPNHPLHAYGVSGLSPYDDGYARSLIFNIIGIGNDPIPTNLRASGTLESVIGVGQRPYYSSLDDAFAEIRWRGLQQMLRDDRTAAAEMVARPQVLNSQGHVISSTRATPLVAGERVVFHPAFTTFEALSGAIEDAKAVVGSAVTTNSVIDIATEILMGSSTARTAMNRFLNDENYEALEQIVASYVMAFVRKYEDENGVIGVNRYAERISNNLPTAPPIAVDNIEVAKWLDIVLNDKASERHVKINQRVIPRPPEREVANRTVRIDPLQAQTERDMIAAGTLPEGYEPKETLLNPIELEQVTPIGRVYSFDDQNMAQFALVDIQNAMDISAPPGATFVDGVARYTVSNERAISSVVGAGTTVTYETAVPMMRAVSKTDFEEIPAGTIVSLSDNLYEIGPTGDLGRAVSLDDPNLIMTSIHMYEGQEVAWPVVGPMIADRVLRKTEQRLVAPTQMTDIGQLPVEAVGSEYSELTFSILNDVDDLPASMVPRQVSGPRIVTNVDALREGLLKQGTRWFFDKVGTAIDGAVRHPLFYHAYVARAEAAYGFATRFLDNWDIATEAQIPLRVIAEQINPQYLEDGKYIYGPGGAGVLLAAEDLFVDVPEYLLVAMREGRISADEFLTRLDDLDPGLLGQLEVNIWETRAARQRALNALLDDDLQLITSPSASRDAEEAARTGLQRTDPAQEELTLTNDQKMKELATNIIAIRRFKQVAQEQAAQAAMRDVLPFIDSHEFKSVYAQYMRNLLPFWYAQENFIKRWVRGGINSGLFGIDTLRAAQLRYMGLRQAGFIEEDEDGTDYVVYPGSAPLNEFIGNTLGWLPGVSGSNLTIMNRARASSLLPGINEQVFDPGVGPLGAIPLTIATYVFPELEPLRRDVLGDIATSSDSKNKFLNIINAMVPRHIARLLEPMMLTEDAIIRMNSAMITIMTNDLARYEAGEESNIPTAESTPAEVQDYLDDVANKARLAMITNAFMGLFTPGSPQMLVTESENIFDYLTGIGVENPQDVIGTTYRDYLAAYGPEDGMDKFLEDYKDWEWADVINPEPLLTSRSETVSGAPLSPTASTMEFYEANAEFAETYPYAFSWIVPRPSSNETVESYAWGKQFTTDLRRRRAPDEVLAAIRFNEASQVYFKFDDERERILLNPNLTDEQVREINEYFDSAKIAFRAANPAFSDMLQNSDPRVRRQNTIDQIRDLVADPLAPESDVMPGIRKMSELHDLYTAARRTLAQSRSQRAINNLTMLKDMHESNIGELLLLYPELELLWLSVYKPESSL